MRVGPPFTTRLRHMEGLAFPPVHEWSHFVCEACTVRAILGRELQDEGRDVALLMLERMRLIDMAHHWRAASHKQYQPLLRQLRHFGSKFDLPILYREPLSSPPVTEDIVLMWAHEYSSLQPKQVSAKRPGADLPKTYGVLKNLRSAASYYHAWNAMIAHPDTAYLDPRSGKISLQQGVRVTDSLAFTFFSSGMGTRLGTETRSSVALLPRHVVSLDTWLDDQYHREPNEARRHQWALAGLANVGLWTTWARATEFLSLRWCDIETTAPARGPDRELPLGIGVVDLTLLPATKASRTKTTDLAIAYTCASGLSLGKWFVRARTTRRPTVPRTAPIFRTHDGCVWTSHYFRHTFLYPHLHRLRLAGDPALRPYDGSSPDNTIEAKFWSLHSYRRGGRTSVSRRHPGTVRKATPDEVNEHGRWAKKRESLDMPTLYAEWTLVQRLAITQLCM